MEKVMYKQYHKSDFKFVMRRYVMRWDEAEQLPWPEVDWRLRLWTPNFYRSYEVSCVGGVMRNCARTNDGGILVVMDNHGLATGELRYEFHFDLPDGAMPSGVADVYKPGSTGIYLTAEPGGECCGLVDVQVLADMYKGDPFHYSDFTAEQLEDLRRPATEAAVRVDEAIGGMTRTMESLTGQVAEERVRLESAREQLAESEGLRAEAEKGRVASEAARRSAEQNREAAENERTGSETARISAETERVAAEAQRRKAETERKTAEAQRVADEAGRRGAESTREAAETLRIGKEAERIADEEIRSANEQQREAAESARTKAFSDALMKATEAVSAAKESMRLATEAVAMATEAAQRCNTAAAEAERLIAQMTSQNYLLLETEQ